MKKYLIYICLMAGIFTSCEKFLDQKSSKDVDSEYLFTTEYGFRNALTQCYINMGKSSLYTGNLTMTTIEYMAQHWTTGGLNDKSAGRFTALDYEADNVKTTFDGVYSSLYNVVVQANEVLNNLEGKESIFTNPAERDVIEAEALTLRAFIHFDILRLFGQMPQNAEETVSLQYAETVGKDKIAWYDFDAYVAKIYDDLKRAEELFRESDPMYLYGYSEQSGFLSYRKYRFNFTALKALKARINLYLGKTTEAYNEAMFLIADTTAAGTKYLNFTEVKDNDITLKRYSMPNESYFLLSVSGLTNNSFKSMPNRLESLDKYKEIITIEDDLRSKLWERGEDAGNSTGGTEPILKKYSQPKLSEDISDNNRKLDYEIVPILRLAEVYLIAIETAPSLDKANELYEDFMYSRNIYGQSLQLLTEENKEETIMMEYQREFYGEGYMFYYYKRNSSPRMKWSSHTTDLGDKSYIVPLPDSEKGKDKL